MAATARLMVLMSPEEKAALEAKAARAGSSAGELVRRAVDAYEIGNQAEAEELRALVQAFDEIHDDTLRRLDENDVAITANLAYLAATRRSV
ncbi:MAG TPA: ribbon-helix-helix protein, CopG family [Acetobacteraceae bacterium]|nr:ribbon-helix-helix protein, CopG family [Acetobacteraceae bacterium]